MPEGDQCEDCTNRALFLHRYKRIDFRFCDRHSLAELYRDQQRGRPADDLVEVVFLP